MRSIPLLVAIASFGSAGAGSAQDVVASYRRARALVDSAIVAHGGRIALGRATRLYARQEGVDHWRNQSPKVDPPYATVPWTGTLYLDLPAARYSWTVTNGFPGGFRNAGRTVVDGAKGFNLNLRQRTIVPAPNRTLATQRAVLNRFPHLILTEVADNPNGLRWLGDLRLSDGTIASAVTWGSPTAPPITLAIDRKTRLVAAIVGVQPDALVGDAASEIRFSDYRQEGGVQIPARRVVKTAGEVTSDVRLTAIEIGGSVPDSLLVAPADATELPSAVPTDDAVRPLAPNVWAVRGGGYWSLAVAYSDHLLVVDAPGGGTGEILARLRDLAPGKPVRYVVPTHHHDDHAGGMRDYMAIGATIVTPPSNRAYFERMARAKPTLESQRDPAGHQDSRPGQGTDSNSHSHSHYHYPVPDAYHLAADHGPPAQLTLGLAVKLDDPRPLAELLPGTRFLLESTGAEGRLESTGTGSALVAVWRPGENRWTRTTWALATEVRPLRG